jgi:hypothetical protein
MKDKLIIFACIGLFGNSLSSHAELFDRGGGLIYDSDNNITWLADADYSRTTDYTEDDDGMTWSAANRWATNLTYEGYSDWRLPTVLSESPYRSEMGTFYQELGGTGQGLPFIIQNDLVHNVQNTWFAGYWTNQEIANDKDRAAAFSFYDGFELSLPKDQQNYAWAVRPGDSAPLGFTPQNPVLPTDNIPNGWQFELNVPNQVLYIDPQIAVGYDYAVDGGPNFTSVLLPSVGDNQFDLYLWNGTEWVFDAALIAGVEHTFSGTGVEKFRITGIETGAGLDPTSPTAFVTGLTFADTGHASLHMTALIVPEPETYVMLLAGLGLVGFVAHRRKQIS